MLISMNPCLLLSHQSHQNEPLPSRGDQGLIVDLFGLPVCIDKHGASLFQDTRADRPKKRSTDSYFNGLQSVLEKGPVLLVVNVMIAREDPPPPSTWNP